MELIIKEENFAGKVLNEISVQLSKELLTVGELIQLRVEQEVEKHNACIQKKGTAYTHEIESQLNQRNAFTQGKLADPEKETFRAWEAFKNNQVFILIDQKQAESLEQEILANENTKVSFIQMTPLVGG